MPRTEAQIRAQHKYDAKNRERTSYLRSRSSARSFIRNKATEDDIAEFRQLLDKREQTLITPNE